MVVQPYLFFDGKCEEALEFYKKAVGANVTALMRFKDSPSQEHNPPGSAEKVMHCNFSIGNSQIMASDGDCKGQMKSDGFALSITADNTDQAEQMFNGLKDGAQITLPLTQTFFAKRFGMLKDKFGVHWMIMAEK
jgi:PhnB protein